MIQHLRGLPDMAATYPTPHDHRIYGMGHHLRVETTMVLARSVVKPGDIVADLSCGNGVIAKDLADYGAAKVILGDFAPRYDITGPLEETIHTIPHVGLYICSETLEHVEDPTAVLTLIRDKAKRMVLSTPLECWDDANGEHLWAWDREGIEGLFNDTGWEPLRFATLDSRTWGEPYLYGIWCAV